MVDHRDLLRELIGLLQVLRREQQRRPPPAPARAPPTRSQYGYADPDRSSAHPRTTRADGSASSTRGRAVAASPRVGARRTVGRVSQLETLEQLTRPPASIRGREIEQPPEHLEVFRPVSISSTAANWPVNPRSSRTPAASRTTSRPKTSAVPASGASNVASTRTSVVFPAPSDRAAQKRFPPRHPNRPSKRRRSPPGPKALDHTLDVDGRMEDITDGPFSERVTARPQSPGSGDYRSPDGWDAAPRSSIEIDCHAHSNRS